MAKAFIITTCGLIILILSYFLIYPKYKEREIQVAFETIAQQRLVDLKTEATTLTKKCERRVGQFNADVGHFDVYYISLLVEYSDKYFIEVRKTDSLTSPYMAVARYPYVIKFYNSYAGSSEKDCLESPPQIKNEENVLTFAYQNDKWVETTK